MFWCDLILIVYDLFMYINLVLAWSWFDINLKLTIFEISVSKISERSCLESIFSDSPITIEQLINSFF
jgi:hypothetical protein